MTIVVEAAWCVISRQEFGITHEIHLSKSCCKVHFGRKQPRKQHASNVDACWSLFGDCKFVFGSSRFLQNRLEWKKTSWTKLGERLPQTPYNPTNVAGPHRFTCFTYSPCSARCILDTSEKRKRIRISIGPGKMNSGWSGFWCWVKWILEENSPMTRSRKYWGKVNLLLLHFHFGFLMSPQKNLLFCPENSWDSWEDGSSETLSATDGGGSVAGGSGQHEIRRESFLFWFRLCIFSKVLENSAQQNPCSFRHSRAAISDFVVKDRSEMLTTYEHDFGLGCPGLVDVTKIDLSTFGKIQLFHTRMFRMSPVLINPPSSKGPQQIDM